VESPGVSAKEKGFVKAFIGAGIYEAARKRVGYHKALRAEHEIYKAFQSKKLDMQSKILKN